MSTTKAEIERTVVEVEVLCDLAQMLVGSHMPVGLGDWYANERDVLLALLDATSERFRVAILRAQKDGWPAE